MGVLLSKEAILATGIHRGEKMENKENMDSKFMAERKWEEAVKVKFNNLYQLSLRRDQLHC